MQRQCRPGIDELSRVRRASVALLLLGLAALPACGGQELRPLASSQTGTQPQRELPASGEQVRLSFAPVVSQVAPAVVSITARRVTVTRPMVFDDPMMQFFFGEMGPGRPRRQVESSLGSGVLVRTDGIVVTNHHVVEGAEQIEVVLADGRSFAASLVRSDPGADLAFLRIDSQGASLPTLALGNSDGALVGDIVLALGNPFGIGQTVTSGIVSATGRTAADLDPEVAFIQTDAAINPGNSGGALVTLDGRLLGINTAIFSRSGGSIGIGFAIPANLVRARMALLERGAASGRP